MRMNLGGIDGCKAGWVLVKYYNGNYELDIHEDFSSLLVKNQELDRVLIDIPIGLSSKSFQRTIESKMRKELENRHSTVFNPPCRLAVYAKSDAKAKEINKQLENKSLSNQSLAIRRKIKEVDEYICGGNSSPEIIESHPELCFKGLNSNKIVQSKKTRTFGIKERLSIIEKYEPNLVKLYGEKAKEIRRKYAKRDDLIDAICLCLVNKLGFPDKLSYLLDKNNTDSEGIKVRIGYYQTKLDTASSKQVNGREL